MMIPKALKNPDFRFVLIKSKTKIPFEKEWTKKNNYSFDDKILQKHIAEGGNYGVIAGYGDLIIIDSDLPEVQKVIDSKLPPTLKVSTSKEGCYHNYYICNDIKKKYVLRDTEQGHYGEIQSKGTQCVGPGSIHPSGIVYKIKEDTKIATITLNKLLNIMWPFLKEDDQQNITGNKKETSSDDIIKQIKNKITIKGLLSDYGYNTTKNPTNCMLGHSSKGGACFSYSDELWNCFHCEKGGDVFSFIMHHENIDFNAAKIFLAKKCGIEVPQPTDDAIPKIWSLQEVKEKGIPSIEWRVNNLIPKKGTAIFGGASGSFKTWAAMQLALSVSTGNKFLDMYETEKGLVLYIDEENGNITIPYRFNLLINGYGYKEVYNNLFLSIFNEFKLDNADSINELTKIIDGLKPKLIIIDSMVRCMTGQEDKASDVRIIFDTLKTYFKKYDDMAFVILHHTTKANNNSMLGLRGSGDFGAFADVILMFQNNNQGYFNVNVAKNRHIDMSKFSGFSVKVDSDNETSIHFEGLEQQLPSDAVSNCIKDIIAWINEDGISSFFSGNLQKDMSKLSHSKDSYFKAIKKMVEKKMISKLSKGRYEVLNLAVIDDKE